MRNRDTIITKIDNIEIQLNQLERIVKTQEPIKAYVETLDKIRNYTEDLRTLINLEQFSASEINKIN